MQIPLFKPQTEWAPAAELPDLTYYQDIAIDLETKDPDLTKRGSGSIINNGKIVGIAVAVKDWSGYFPVAHEGGGNLDSTLVFKWLRNLLKNEANKIFHNAMYDVCWLKSLGNMVINGRIIDTMIAASLVNENRFRYDLNSLSRDYLGMGKDEIALKNAAKEWGIDPKAELYKLPAIYVGAYAEKDAELTLALWKEMKKEIHHQDLLSIFSLETDLFPCLVDMRFKGQLLLKIKKETEIDTQIWAARSIAKVFDKLKLPYERTEKTQSPSFTKNFLQNHPHPLVQCIAKAREINKAHTTFIDTIIKYEHKGRIHAEINQLRSDQGGTVTGRFSYAHPNLQQVPARNKELGPMIRSLFIPEKGHKWGCFDYEHQN